jgi:hypothetical protein
MKPDKFESFSKAFSQLSDESQNKLIKTAHCLLQAHLLTKQKSSKQSGILKKAECCVGK